MLKEWTVKFIFVIAVLIFLLNDALNWDFVKTAIQKQLENNGLFVEKIEKITASSIHLRYLHIQDKTIHTLILHFDPIHLLANGIKRLVNRTDFSQDFSIAQCDGIIETLPFSLVHPVQCSITPFSLQHKAFTLKLDSGSASISSGDLYTLSQKIELFHIPLPDTDVKISGAFDLPKKSYNLKIEDSVGKIPFLAYIKGVWTPLFEANFAGKASIYHFDQIDFAGKITPSFDNLKNSTVDVRGKWKGTLREVYSALNSSFGLVQGDIAATLKLTGTVQNLKPQIKAAISKGTFEIPSIGLFLNNLQAIIEGDSLCLHIKDLKAQDTEKTSGSLLGSGELDFSNLSSPHNANFKYQLQLGVKNVTLLDMENLKGISSGDLQVTGDRNGVLFKGKGNVHKLEFLVDNAVNAKKYPLPILFTDETLNKTPSLYPVLFDIDLHLENYGNVTGQNLSSEWSGKAHLGGSTQELSLTGKMKLINGEYRLNGKNIEIKEGEIRFNGNIFKETTVFALSQIELKDLIAEIIVRGHLDTLNLTLRSNPPLPQREILSWILFNQGARHITGLEGEQLNRSLSEFTKGGSRKNILSDIQGKLGIDSIDLDRRTFSYDEEVSLKLGKYLSKNLFVGVSRGINSEVNRIGFEASLNQHWKVQGEIGDNAQGQLHLKWKNDY